MSKLLPITIASIILAALSHFLSPKSPQTGTYLRKERIVWIVLAGTMVCFAGLRLHYNDTDTYVYAYNAISTDWNRIFCIQWQLGDNPGFHVLNNLLVLLGFSAQSFLMFYSTVTVGIYLWFIRKYTNNLWLSVFLFLTLGSYTFTMAAIKQCVAVAFCLVGVDKAINRKWCSFVLWVLLGALFHPYALMYLLVPFLFFRPWSSKTYVLLLVFAVAGLLLQPLMNTVINVTTMLGEEYNAASFSGEGVNPLRLMVTLVPLFLSFITKYVIWKKHDRTQNLILNLSMLNGTIMFVALFGTANYFARLANYFLIFQTISIPWLFDQFERKSKILVITLAVICYFSFFYYSNAINQPFDNYYYGTSLLKYLKSLI